MSTRRSTPCARSLLVALLSLSLTAPGHAEEVRSTATLEAQLSVQRARIAREEARKQALTAQRARLPSERRDLEQTLARDVRALYRLRRGGLLPLVGGLDAWFDHAARVAHLERMAARTLASLELRRAADDELAQDLVESDRALLEQTRELGELEQARARRAQQEAAALRLAAAAPLAMPGADEGRMQYGLALSASAASADFEAERGALAPPVPLASRAAPRSGRHGLALAAAPGTSVRAAAAGRVTYADRHPQHGLLVIVEHPDGYRTLYGELAAIDVQPGDALSKSTRLGSAGDAPVHFELRRGERGLDVRPWLER